MSDELDPTQVPDVVIAGDVPEMLKKLSNRLPGRHNAQGELRPCLEECLELAEEGADHIITSNRSENVNMRMQLERIIRRAGLSPWPKLFHNLRASRQTELAAEFPIHVVCEWIGNTAAIAAKHYLTVQEEDFDRASQGSAKNGAPVAHFPAQQGNASLRTKSQESSEVLEVCEDMRAVTIGCKKKHPEACKSQGG